MYEVEDTVCICIYDVDQFSSTCTNINKKILIL